MNGKSFFDTNVLVYSFQTPDRKRSAFALDLVSKMTESQQAVISFQVVQEFYSVAFRKISPPMGTEEAQFYLKNVLGKMEIVQSSQPLYEEALSIRERFRFSWYDSLIVAAALKAQCNVLYSEDMQGGQQIESLTIINPFRELT